jgi:hypothetical protein
MFFFASLSFGFIMLEKGTGLLAYVLTTWGWDILHLGCVLKKCAALAFFSPFYLFHI